MKAMEPRTDRLDLVLQVVAESSWLTLRRLAAAADVGLSLLNRHYRSKRSQETVEKIARGAAALLEVEEKRLLAWLHGGNDRALEAFLRELPCLRQCTRCGDRVPESEMVVELSRCRDCVRAQARDLAFRRRLGKNPDLACYYKELRERLPAAREKDPELATVVEHILAAARAVKKTEVARILNAPRRDVDIRWRRAGLPLLPLLVALHIATARGAPPTGATSELVCRVEKRRRRKGGEAVERSDQLTDPHATRPRPSVYHQAPGRRGAAALRAPGGPSALARRTA